MTKLEGWNELALLTKHAAFKVRYSCFVIL